MSVNVAALNLPGVGDVVWDLEVDNGAGQVVWQKRVSSSGFGDGAGSASYIGPCDADPAANPNTVKVWVVGVYASAVGSAGTFSSGSTAGAGAVSGAALPFENPTGGGAPLTRTVVCQENADIAVQFDITLMRPAEQGFFDIAVNFNNIFCSAKFDCCDDADDSGSCDAGEDLTLLFNTTGARGRSMVLGFACTAGTAGGVNTTLLMDQLAFDCTSPASGFSADFTINPAAPSLGNQCTVGDLGNCTVVNELNAPTVSVDDYLFQVAVYRGDEQLLSGGVDAHKAYWNIALGVTGSIGACTLRTRATAEDANNDGDGVVGGVVTAGVVYPYINWDVPLGTCASEPLTFGGAGMVRTQYSETNASADSAFGYLFAPGLPPAPVCEQPCLNGGTCSAPNTCTCPEGWTGSQCETVSSWASCLALYQAGTTTSGTYQLDPEGDGTSFTAYCDMQTDGGGWTLVGKFSNQDAKHWIDAKSRWTGTATFGDATTLAAGSDAKSEAWASVVASELLFTDTDDAGKYMQTTNNCIGGTNLSSFFTTMLAAYPDTSSQNHKKQCDITKTYTYAPHWMAEPDYSAPANSDRLGPNHGYILIGHTDSGDTAAVISGYATTYSEADVGLGADEDIENETSPCGSGFCTAAKAQDIGGPTSCNYDDTECRNEYPETVYLWVR